MRTDIQLDETGDLLISNGNLVVGESDNEHIGEILRAYPGEYKQSPMIGVDIKRAINGAIDGNVRRDIRLNLQADGLRVSNLVFTETQLNIDADYTG